MSGYYETVLEAIENPEYILRGYKGAKVAVVNIGRSRWLLVIYREDHKNDGFVISAYIDNEFKENLIVWKRSS